MSSYVETADKALKKFASTGLKPDEAEVTKGNKMVHEIFELLRQKSRYPPARCAIGGSIGKATAIPGSDYDLVVFVNDEEPPYKDILDDYEDVLLMANHPKIVNVKLTRHSVQFQVNGIDVDLLPAQNFVKGIPNLDGDKLAEKQADLALAKIEAAYRRDSSAVYNYSSSLVEYHVLFMKRQSSFIHELARICKFWSKTLILDDRVSGQSTIIELIAAHAGQAEENNQSPPSILRAFRRFLEQMGKLECMGIKFDFPGPNLTCHPPTFSKPFLIEPSNPFNNFAGEITRKTMDNFKTFAGETLLRLENEMHIWAKLGYFPLELLFQPQPRIINPLGAKPSRCIVTLMDYTSKNPNMIVRSEKKFKREIADMQRRLKMTLFTAVHGFTSAQKPNVSDDEVKKLAQAQVDRHAYGVESQSWGGGGYTHEDCDVTFEIPFANKAKAVRASFSWD